MSVTTSNLFLSAIMAVVVSGSVRADNTPFQMGFDYQTDSFDAFYLGKDDQYAAIAYSRKTEKYGFAHGCYSREIAERQAIRNCPADDAKIVTWVCNGFCALAVGENGAWGGGYSNDARASNTAAKNAALRACAKHSDKPRILICVCSVKRKPEIYASVIQAKPAQVDSVR